LFGTAQEGQAGMSDFARLVQDLPSSPALQARLEQVDSVDSAVSAAREAGYSITGEEISAYVKGLQDGSQKDLSDAQLDAVAGGKKKAGPDFSVLLNVTGNGAR
jgi:predicted ribosomally synthesized peptide with nif11-like leader